MHCAWLTMAAARSGSRTSASRKAASANNRPAAALAWERLKMYLDRVIGGASETAHEH